MANPWTGEVALTIDGERRVLKLTLGALAELEQELNTGSLVELVQRFEGGAYSSSDVLALIVAGLRGGGRETARPEGQGVEMVDCGAVCQRFMPDGKGKTCHDLGLAVVGTITARRRCSRIIERTSSDPARAHASA